MSDMSDELSILAGAYALDALDATERGLFEQHLRTCTRCVEEVAGLRAAAAELSHIAATPPPTHLRANVLDEISRVRPLPPITARLHDLRTRRSAARWWPAMAAACLVIALGSTTWGISQHISTSNAAIDLRTVLTAPDARTLTGEFRTGGRATVVVSKQLNRMVLVASDVTDPGSGKTYELWRIRPGGAPVPAGTFIPDAGNVLTRLASDDVGSTTAIAITVERSGGVTAPTTQAVLSIKV